MSKPFDVAIIGAGHNGLVAANYLARAGKSVCVIEARELVGGACVTEELIPGAKWSSCSFIQGMLRPEIIADLSTWFELFPGDLIFTGTPAGVGPLLPGDRVRGGVDGIGVLDYGIVAR